MNTNGDTIVHPTLSKERVVEHTMERAALARATASPLPGALAQAFGPDSIEICGVQVRSVVAADFRIFHFINSPFLEMIKEAEKKEEARDPIESTDEQEWEAVYQFTHPAEDVWKLAKTPDKFRDMATAEIGLKPEWNGKIQPVLAAIIEQLSRYGKTLVQYKAQAEENGEITFFRDLKARQKTGSDGSSNITQGS